MAYTNNAFCWHGVISTDVDTAANFYTQVLPWSKMTTPMGDETATMFTAADIPRAHLMAPPMAGVPSHWDNYLRVEDVDAATAAASANGGTVVVPCTDIAPGRFSVVTSPSGAMLSLFRESDDSAQNAPGGDGAIHWTELHSKDLEADLAWLEATFGITHDLMPMPNGDYFVLKSGEAMVGGAMNAMSDEAPAMWLTWIQVANVDQTVEAATSNQGKVLSPVMDVPNVGRMAVLMDPTGGVFGAITPASH